MAHELKESDFKDFTVKSVIAGNRVCKKMTHKRKRWQDDDGTGD